MKIETAHNVATSGITQTSRMQSTTSKGKHSPQ
jgi:hypothetical protein